MSRWGCIGLLGGSLLGALLLMVLFRLIQPTIPVTAAQTGIIPSDLSLFLSEQSLSHFASKALDQPAAVNFEPGGQMILTTSVNITGLKPVVDLGLSLTMQGNQVVSELHWLQIGFIRLPAKWLPPEIVAVGVQPGQQLTSQIPPAFSLVSLTTTTEGVNLQLDLTGP